MRTNIGKGPLLPSFKEGLAPRLRAGRVRAFMLGLIFISGLLSGVPHASAAPVNIGATSYFSSTNVLNVFNPSSGWTSYINSLGAPTDNIYIMWPGPAGDSNEDIVNPTTFPTCSTSLGGAYNTVSSLSNSVNNTYDLTALGWTPSGHYSHFYFCDHTNTVVGYLPIYFSTTGSTVSAPVYTTSITAITPADGSLIATSSTATLSVTGAINSADISSSTVATMSFYRNADMQAAVASPSLITTTLTFPISSSGSFSDSTTTPLLEEGTYTLTTAISKPTYSLFGFNFFTTTLVSTTTSFTVGTTTAWDNFQSQSITNIQNTINTFATSTCALNFTSFNLGDCVLSFVWPGPGAFDQFKTLTLSNRAPFAYAYQIPTLINAVFDSPLAASSTISYDFDGFGSLTIFSQSLLSSIPFAALIKGLLTAFMWFGGALVIYRKIMGVHDHTSHV